MTFLEVQNFVIYLFIFLRLWPGICKKSFVIKEFSRNFALIFTFEGFFRRKTPTERGQAVEKLI